MSDVSLCFGFFHRFPRMLGILSFFDLVSRTFRAGGSWPLTPLLVTLATLAPFQAHCFVDFMTYRCHPVSCVVDVRLFDEVN